MKKPCKAQPETDPLRADPLILCIEKIVNTRSSLWSLIAVYVQPLPEDSDALLLRLLLLSRPVFGREEELI